MGELTQATEVYSVAPQHRTQQLWRALLSWLTFFFQIFFQILRTLGHYPLLSFSSSNNHNNTSFKPLPYVELHDRDEQDNRLLPPRLISLLPPPITPLPIDSKNSRCIVNLVKWWKQIQLQKVTMEGVQIVVNFILEEMSLKDEKSTMVQGNKEEVG